MFKGTAPITKNGKSDTPQSEKIYMRGRHPLKKDENAYRPSSAAAKKIAVIDENGKEYEATYVKRARGLVKSGRARFIDDATICLACPPDNIKLTEDNSMTNTENYNVNLETGEVTVQESEGAIRENTSRYTLEYFLEQIEKLTSRYAGGTEYIVGAIGRIPNEGTPCGGAGEEVAKAAADAVRYRETTVQKTLDFYFRMVDELKPKTENSNSTSSDKAQFLDWVATCVQNARPGVETPDYAKLWNEIK